MKIGWENRCRVSVEDQDEYPDPISPESQTLIFVRRLVGVILADTHPALGAECLALVTGIGYMGSSMAQIAVRHKVTRAAVSRRCVDLCNAFGIPPVRAMRPLKNRSQCRRSRHKSLSSQ